MNTTERCRAPKTFEIVFLLDLLFKDLFCADILQKEQIFLENPRMILNNDVLVFLSTIQTKIGKLLLQDKHEGFPSCPKSQYPVSELIPVIWINIYQ